MHVYKNFPKMERGIQTLFDRKGLQLGAAK